MPPHSFERHVFLKIPVELSVAIARSAINAGLGLK